MTAKISGRLRCEGSVKAIINVPEVYIRDMNTNKLTRISPAPGSVHRSPPLVGSPLATLLKYSFIYELDWPALGHVVYTHFIDKHICLVCQINEPVVVWVEIHKFHLPLLQSFGNLSHCKILLL